MAEYIVTYKPSTEEIVGFYDTVKEALDDAKFLNLFGRPLGKEELKVARVELTDEEYQKAVGGEA